MSDSETITLRDFERWGPCWLDDEDHFLEGPRWARILEMVGDKREFGLKDIQDLYPSIRNVDEWFWLLEKFLDHVGAEGKVVANFREAFPDEHTPTYLCCADCVGLHDPKDYAVLREDRVKFFREVTL